MAKPTPKRAAYEGTVTPDNRKYVIGIVLALLAFIVIVIVDTLRRDPQAQLYVVLRDLHFQVSRLGLVIAASLAALAAHIGIRRKGDVTPLFRAATYIIVGLMLLQSSFGALMFLQGGRPREDVHYIYGMASVLALPFFIFVEVTAKKRPAMGSYIWGFALLAGVILRSIMTGA